jgi:putative aldouronate transport system permease protein
MAKQTGTRMRESTASRIFDVLNYVLLGLLGLVTLGPFIYLALGSLTSPVYYRTVGVAWNPVNWTLDSYRILLGTGSRILQSLKITTFITVAGTIFGLAVTSALAYGISKKDLPGRNFFIFFIFFTMLFGGGLVPFYLVVKWLKMVNTVWSLIIPGGVSAWYMFIMVRFFDALPVDLEDAARIDGCSEIGIFWRIVLPLSMPAMATIGLFYAVAHWNQWFWATVFITKQDIMPLQLVLRNILAQLMPVTDTQTAIDMVQAAQEMPSVDVLRMASIIVTVVPIAMVYPFLQRYFVKGVIIGAIKG